MQGFINSNSESPGKDSKETEKKLAAFQILRGVSK